MKMTLKGSQNENNKMTYTMNAIRDKLPVEGWWERIMVYQSDYKHEVIVRLMVDQGYKGDLMCVCVCFVIDLSQGIIVLQVLICYANWQRGC